MKDSAEESHCCFRRDSNKQNANGVDKTRGDRGGDGERSRS
ncbi:hypothetical protein [Chroococcidiopsis cubana]|nr:hypothetical protein [Chroococcidiopsis cubana]